MKLLIRMWTTFAAVMGDDAYERYCEHLKARHPEVRPMTAGEFYVARLEQKYRRPNRCC